MTKYCDNGASSTANRGVEAKELEIAHTRLDRNTNTSSSTSLPVEGSALGDSSAQTTQPTLDVTGSYVQVVVQKHRRTRAATSAAQTSPRLPAASSPIRQCGQRVEGGGDGVVVLPASVLLSAPHAQHALLHTLQLHKTIGDAGDAADAAQSARAHQQKYDKNSNWKVFNNMTKDKMELCENEGVPAGAATGAGPGAAEAERVEVYYFERCEGGYLSARGARVTRAERAGRRAARAGGAALDELLAAAQLLLSAPIALLVGVERCVLTGLRDVVVGGVATATDYALKPCLALAFSAGAAPALACAGQGAAALRDALRPLWLLLGDALEPLARALGQLSLVRVSVCRCHDAHAV